MIINKVLAIFTLLVMSITGLFAQSPGKIQIRLNEEQTASAIAAATVELGSKKAKTDDDGIVFLEDLEAGTYALRIEAIGYAVYRDTIHKNAAQDLNLQIVLSKSNTQIEGITVLGKTELQRQKQAPIRSVQIDTRAIATQASSLTDIINSSTGIRVRQNGGLGSKPELSINGFQGKAIKYFKDGIPMDYLGDGYNLSSLSMETLERVEIYKGVLPVSLGADALGGAVNLVSSQPNKPSMRAYYEIGSFQTHRVGLLTNFQSKNQSFAYGLDAYYNYSDNDYKAWVDVPNPETKNLEEKHLPLFHNAYKHMLAEAFGALRNQSWTDELKFSLIGFNLQREQQHPSLMTDAYGAVLAKQQTIAPSLRYKKSLWEDKIKIDQFTGYNILNTERIDTLHGRYDWYGNFSPSTQIGETRIPSQSDIQEKQWMNRTNLAYQINPLARLEFNYVFSRVDREGKDPLGPKFKDTEIDVLSQPADYQKQVFGLSLENYFWNERIQNQLVAKHYRYKASGINNTWYSTDVTENDRRQITGNYWGVTEAIKYQLNPNSLLRASAEYSYRLPEREELFGNQVFVVPNFELNPEQSLNLNLGYQQRFFSRLNLELNAFYRRTKGLILLVPIQAPNAQYQNQDQVKGFGMDLDLVYQLSEQYQLNGNATWQDLRLFGITNLQDAWKNDARLRNTPYFFANLGAQAKYKNLFAEKDQWKVFLHYNFMREFYLETIPKDLEPGGFLGLQGSANLQSDLIIPNQHLINIGTQYQFANGKMFLAAEMRNVMNEKLYDYYRIQRPGRSIHLKLSYQL